MNLLSRLLQNPIRWIFAGSLGLSALPAMAAIKVSCEDGLKSSSAFASTSSLENLHLGLVAYHPDGSLTFDQFADKIRGLVAEAVGKGAQMVVLPELIVQDLVDHTKGEDSFGPQVRASAAYWDKFLALNVELSHKHGIILYSGTFPRSQSGKIFNTGALVFPDGEYFLQDKMFMTPFEKIWGISPGDKLTVIQTVWGNWVNLTCYDCEIPMLSNLLADVEPTLILVPSMTEASTGFRRVRWTAQARAIEHKTYVVHLGLVGGPESWTNHSQCSVLGPSDDIMCGLIAESPLNTPGVFPFELDFKKLNLSRLSGSVFPARDQVARKGQDNP